MAAAPNAVPQDAETAAIRLAQELVRNPSDERWNNWAAAQAQSGRYEEALAGFTCALELDAANPIFLGNLAWVAVELRSWRQAAHRAAEAIAHLPPGSEPARARLEELRAQAAAQQPPWSPEQAAQCLSAFRGDDDNEREYFATHQRRYLATLDMVPAAQPGARGPASSTAPTRAAARRREPPRPAACRRATSDEGEQVDVAPAPAEEAGTADAAQAKPAGNAKPSKSSKQAAAGPKAPARVDDDLKDIDEILRKRGI